MVRPCGPTCLPARVPSTHTPPNRTPSPSSLIHDLCTPRTLQQLAECGPPVYTLRTWATGPARDYPNALDCSRLVSSHLQGYLQSMSIEKSAASYIKLRMQGKQVTSPHEFTYANGINVIVDACSNSHWSGHVTVRSVHCYVTKC